MSPRPQNTAPLSPMIATFALLTQPASALPSDASALERSISLLESCISALDSKAESLANSSAGLEPWAWVFTSLVVVGILMELWVIWDEHSEDMETWAETFFGIQRTLRPPTGRLVVEYFTVVLVALGIIGELVIGIEIASVNSQLRGVDTQLRSKNAELRTASDQLVALINSEAEEAGSVGGRANKRAAKLEIENTRLKLIVNGRSIDLDKQRKIADSCSQFAGHVVMVQSYALDTEAFAFGEQVIATLHAMGAVVADNRATFIGTGGMESGVHVRNPDKSEFNFAFCLATSFKVIGELQTSLNDPQPKYGSVSGGGGQAIKPGVPFVWVMIGVKPLPLIDNKNSKPTK